MLSNWNIENQRVYNQIGKIILFMMAKFHKEIPFLHKNDLLNGIVQVSEWNFDLTSVNLRVA